MTYSLRDAGGACRTERLRGSFFPRPAPPHERATSDHGNARQRRRDTQLDHSANRRVGHQRGVRDPDEEQVGEQSVTWLWSFD